MTDNIHRRCFLSKCAVIGAATCLGKLPAVSAAGQDEAEVSPLEDLMREHGLLNRVLLIYDHCADRLQSKQTIDLKALTDARGIIKNFVEAYHEKLEEEHLFPRAYAHENSRLGASKTAGCQ